ncbi:ABC transporter substrate-binding protein [Frankia sp. AgB1.9]|nr:ABC transporter substrate-binding protein [Frankia sp. AgW1.1]MBL7548863.1 ABC transporter substrate-binding protein [Frankia sp. AgB1.9]MBL7619700.1 ABC transporter substrate-binding protein [Frankia sp. AgB1.8]
MHNVIVELRRRHLAAVAVCTVAASLALAGCTKSGQGAAASCDSPGVSPTEVHVGLIYPDSGAIAPGFRAARSGTEARVAVANAAGGVNGRKIVLDWHDDEGSTSGFAVAASDLLTQNKDFGLIAQSISVGSTAQQLDKQGIPVTGLPGESVWTEHRNMFTFGFTFGSTQSASSSVTTFGLYAHRFNATRAAIVYNDTLSQSATALVQLFRESLQSQGIAVADPIVYNPTVTNPGKVVTQIRASRADSLISILSADDFLPIYTAARQSGLTFKVALATSGYDAQLLSSQGASMAGMSILTPHIPFSVDSTALRDYKAAMSEYAPELDQPTNEVALGAYITTDEFLRGLALAGACPTRAAFITNLRALKSYDAGGLIPVTDLSRFGEPNLCYSFVRVNDAGTAFEVVPSVGAPDPNEWCGTRLGVG